MNRKTLLLLPFIFILFGCPRKAHAQVPVALSPVARQQFFSATGVPLAAGCVSFFIAGTTTPQATYTDSSGLFQNANPLTLDGGGFGVAYLSNISYKVQVNAAPSTGVCSSVNLGALQWVQDNVSAYQILNNLSNLFFSPVTSDPSGTAGEMGYRSDISCFRGFIAIWDCFVMRSSTDTLTNKTINATTNTIISSVNTDGFVLRANGTSYVGNAIQAKDVFAFSQLIANDSVTGTSLNKLTKLTANTPATVITTTTSDLGGIIGICISQCGVSGSVGSAYIQNAGIVSCVFDGATSVGDYVVNSTTVAGDCHDASVLAGGNASLPSNTQVIGRVLTTQPGAGTYSILLFPPEIHSTAQIVAFVNGTYTNATTTFSTIQDGALPPNAFSWSLNPRSQYSFSCDIIFQGSVVTAGPKFQLSGTVTVDNVTFLVDGGTNVTAYANGAVGSGAFPAIVVTLGTLGAATTNLVAHLNGSIHTTGTAGTFLIQAAANGAGTLTISSGVCRLLN